MYKKAFTLIEVIIVTGIIGIAATITYTSLSSLREKSILEENVQKTVSILRHVQQAALHGKASQDNVFPCAYLAEFMTVGGVTSVIPKVLEHIIGVDCSMAGTTVLDMPSLSINTNQLVVEKTCPDHFGDPTGWPASITYAVPFGKSESSRCVVDRKVHDCDLTFTTQRSGMKQYICVLCSGDIFVQNTPCPLD